MRETELTTPLAPAAFTVNPQQPEQPAVFVVNPVATFETTMGTFKAEVFLDRMPITASRRTALTGLYVDGVQSLHSGVMLRP